MSCDESCGWDNEVSLAKRLKLEEQSYEENKVDNTGANPSKMPEMQLLQEKEQTDNDVTLPERLKLTETSGDDTNPASPPKMSKKQLKKLKKKENWLKRLPEKRAKEKARKKLKKLRAKLDNTPGPDIKQLKSNTMEKSNCQIHVVIDLSFDEYMNSKDLSKCIKQILRCYSLNRRAKNPMQLHVTNFNGRSKEEMTKNLGYENWDVHFHDENYMEIFKKEDIVYLSSESDNVLSNLEDKVYIIGGLVDHNSQKGLCHRIAQEHNLQHGQLPITEYLEMKTRKVLTIDHVFEILLGVSEGKSWKDAFLAVLPQRKGAIQKDQNTEEENVNNGEGSEIT